VPLHRCLRVLLTLGLLAPSLVAAQPRRLLLVIDASASMAERRAGETRFHVALQAAQQAVHHLPADAEVGVRVYGGQVGLQRKSESCRDSSLRLPFQAAAGLNLMEALSDIRPQGFSPIAHGLQLGAQDFGEMPGPRDLLLLSDGDDTCGGDPIAVARELSLHGVQVRVQTIVFRGDEIGRRALAQLSHLTGGETFVAADETALTAALEQAMREVLYPAVTAGDLDSAVDAGPDETRAMLLAPKKYARSTLSGVDPIDMFVVQHSVGTKVRLRVRVVEPSTEGVVVTVSERSGPELFQTQVTTDDWIETDPLVMPASRELFLSVRSAHLNQVIVYQLEVRVFSEVG